MTLGAAVHNCLFVINIQPSYLYITYSVFWLSGNPLRLTWALSDIYMSYRGFNWD